MSRYQVLFRGNVQGVGFRYTVLETSHRFEVTGFVRNLPDRTVELVCEGERPVLKQFVETICQRRDTYIAEHEIREQEATGEFERFRISS